MNEVKLSLSVGFDEKTTGLIQALIQALGNGTRASAQLTEARAEKEAQEEAEAKAVAAAAKKKADDDAAAKAKALAAKKQAEIDAALAAEEEAKKAAEVDPLADVPAKDAPKVSFEDVLKALSEYRDIEGTQAVVDLLASYGAEHVKKLDPAHYAEVVAKAQPK